MHALGRKWILFGLLCSRMMTSTALVLLWVIKAQEDKPPDLAEWADKLAHAMLPAAPPRPLLANLNPSLSVINAAAGLGRHVRGIR